MDQQKRLLIKKIEEAFSELILFDDMTLRKCAAWDSRVEEGHPDLADISICSKWQDIPDKDMHLFGTHGVFSHSGKKNTGFYLARAMVYVLKYYSGRVIDPVDDIVSATECAIESAPRLNKDQTIIVSEYALWLESMQS